MHRSRFAHILPGNILWHALTFQKLQTPAKIASLFESSEEIVSWKEAAGDEMYQLLCDYGFLVDFGQDEKQLGEAKNKAGSTEVQNLFLILTTGCNLCCTYCFYNKKDSSMFARPVENMSDEMARQAIDLFMEITSGNNRDRPQYWEQITFYGGEPLLNRQCLESVLGYIKLLKAQGRIRRDVDLVINTNGTLVDRDFARIAVSEELIVQISVDGPSEVHNINRFYEDNQGSFEHVMEALKLLSNAGARIMPMVTVNANNVDHLDEFIDQLCREFGIKRYMMNVLMSTTEKDVTDYPRRAAEAMLLTHCKTSRYGAYDENFAGLLSGFGGPSIARQSCGVGRKITVFPNGQTHTCQAFGGTDITQAGTLIEFGREHPNWRHWQKRNRFNDDTCLQCPVVGSCGGGCAAGSFHSNNSIHAIDFNQCEFTKWLFARWVSGQYNDL